MPAEVRPFEPRRDAGAVAALVDMAFGGPWPGYEKRLRTTPRALWKNYRCLVDDGELVAHLLIVPKDMYVGRALLRVGGIAAVCTHPARRKEGYGQALMEDTVAFLGDEGYDFSVLYGIPGYYHRFGYEVVMARHFITLAQSELALRPIKARRSAIAKADLPLILRLYNSQIRYRDGNCRRRDMPSGRRGFKLTGDDGTLIAYALWSANDSTMQVQEAIARDAAAARELLWTLGAVAWREGLDQLTISMPPGYHLTDAALDLNCIYHRANTAGRGCMGRVINLPSLAQKMETEWSRRLTESPLEGRDARVRLQLGGEVLSIGFDGRAADTTVETGRARAASSMTPQKFAQALMGYRVPRAMAAAGEAAICASDAPLLDALFPQRASFLFASDKF